MCEHVLTSSYTNYLLESSQIPLISVPLEVVGCNEPYFNLPQIHPITVTPVTITTTRITPIIAINLPSRISPTSKFLVAILKWEHKRLFWYVRSSPG